MPANAIKWEEKQKTKNRPRNTVLNCEKELTSSLFAVDKSLPETHEN